MSKVFFDLKLTFADNPESDLFLCDTLDNLSFHLPSDIVIFVKDKFNIMGYMWETFSLSLTQGIDTIRIEFSHYSN